MLVVAMAGLLVAGGATAQEQGKERHDHGHGQQGEATADARGEGYGVLGLTVRPYAHVLAQRPSGPDDWSMGLGGGAKIEWQPIWGAVEYTFHDVLDDWDTFPYDGTFTAKLGVYKAPAKDARVVASPHAAFIIARPTGPDDWSPGFEAGVEFILDPIYLGLDYTLRDIFLGKNDEVYDWDSELALGLGVYF